MKYYATFTCNNGSTYLNGAWEYTNKAKAIREIKASMWANHLCQRCNQSRYVVYDENDIVVAAGWVFGHGQWLIDHDRIGTHSF